MTNDAKFGLLAGLTAVLAVAVFYTRQPSTATGSNPPAPSKVIPAANAPIGPLSGQNTAPVLQGDSKKAKAPTDPLLRTDY